jgi:hypothetical protein
VAPRLVFAYGLDYNTASSASGGDVKGVRFERLGTGRYYNVILHIGTTYVPVSDETIEELKTHTLLSPDRFLDVLIQKVGYSSYLKEQIRNELKKSGDPITQVTVLQGAIRDL